MYRFCHSGAWGFDNSIIEKKEYAKQFLDGIGLRCCIEYLCKYDESNNVFKGNENHIPYLVLVIDNKSFKRIGVFDITDYSQLCNYVENNLSESFRKNRLVCIFIKQLQPCDGCFTANIISNGKGYALIEFIDGTVDNRMLSSGGSYRKQPKRIIFNEYKMVYCEDNQVLLHIWESIKVCLFFKGYYECSYASVNNKKDIYFTYFSNKDIYQNISLEYINYDMLKYRCLFLSLLEI